VLELKTGLVRDTVELQLGMVLYGYTQSAVSYSSTVLPQPFADTCPAQLVQYNNYNYCNPNHYIILLICATAATNYTMIHIHIYFYHVKERQKSDKYSYQNTIVKNR